jgi:serine/threonine protein kinase
MSFDKTQHQSERQLRQSRDLSLEPTRPPAKIEGYVIQNFLGRGSYGEVWSAIDQKTGKRVAIKFYSQRSSVDVQQLAQEVEKLVVLSADRYVVQLLDVGWDATPPYYVMDYIEHGSIEDKMKLQQTVPVSEAVELFEEVATGLMHLHGKGILHCDLKPGNVLLDQDGKPRVADFGQSRLHTDDTSALGTLYYMAPEQADLDAVPDARWDVYGLGALLFTMLTGKPPYYSTDLTKRIEAKNDLRARLKLYRRSLSSAEKPNQHRQIAGVDRSLADVIDRCIAANPKDRFESVQSVILALRQREFRRQRSPLLLLGILGPLLLLGVASAFGWWAFRQATAETVTAIVDKAHETNIFAAQLAAQSAAVRIDEYFHTVESLSRDEDFLIAFDSLIANEELAEYRKTFSDPNDNNREPKTDEDKSFLAKRKAYRSHPSQKVMDSFLRERLSDPDNLYPTTASWFVTDRYGNQIASDFGAGVENKTLGKNYGYRTYFTGLDEDIKRIRNVETGKEFYELPTDPSQRKIIDSAHLSASFLSRASFTWKIAISAPIIRDNEVLGIVAATVDFGNLIDFKNSPDHYVSLVDNREGEFQGIILEHPHFKEMIAKLKEKAKSAGETNPTIKLPQELTDVKVMIGQAITDDHVFWDPIGKTETGSAYDRKSIVAASSVDRQVDEIETTESDAKVVPAPTGLYVLAYEEYKEVVEPSRKLSERLGRLLLMAVLILLALAIGMWLLVSRLFKESGFRLAQPFTAGSGSLGNMLTTPSARSTRSESSSVDSSRDSEP